MKIRKTLLSFVGAMMFVMGFTSCTNDWGKQDPPAGNEVYPSRQVVVTYDFEYSEEKPELSDMDATSNVCEVVMDDSLASNVLRLEGAGAVRIVNPFSSVSLQNGAAIAFYVKTDSTDLDRPLFTFGGAKSDSTGCFYFTANGQLSYSKPNQLESLNLNENDPSVYKTGILTPGKWHYVALQVSTTGYQLYVDGNKSLSGAATSTSSTSFSYQMLVDFIQSAPYIYIGTRDMGDEHYGMSIDDITFVRNQMTEADWNKKPGGGGSNAGTFESVDYVNEDGTPKLNIGSSDCSAAWWTEFSDYYRIPAEGTIQLKFTNHTSGVGNWNNWNLCVATDDTREGGNYAEYFVIRSDLYGWGDSYDGSNFSNEGYPSDDNGWATFRSEMEGAVVNMTISRSGATVSVKAVATCPSGKVYTENFHATCGDGKDVIRAFLIVDGSYIVLDQAECSTRSAVDVTTTNIGTSDCSAAWWTTFSDYFQIPAGTSLHLGFTNHTSGVGNWNNWNLCVSTDDDREGGNYAEYFVIRSDLYGWGDSYNGSNFSNEGYPSDDNGWATFRSEMEGAVVDMTITRTDAEVSVSAVQTCPSGKVYTENFHATCGDGKDVIRAFLIVDGSYLVMDAVNCYISQSIYK